MLDLAATRFNRYSPLLGLGRVADAQKVLEGCLEDFREAGDLTNQAKALTALAEVWDARGDTGQAIALFRQALSASDRLADPEYRAICHEGIAVCLHKAGQAEEAARHELAALAYCLVTGRSRGLHHLLGNIRVSMRKAATSGTRYEPPPLDALLSRPEFDALCRFLQGWGGSPELLRWAIDHCLQQARNEP